MRSFFDRFYDALRSVKLAVILFVLLVLFAIVGGIVPQGKPPDFYLGRFPSGGASIILTLGIDHVFSSIPFLLVSAAFVLNLTICTFHRLSGEFFKPRGKRRHGPDLLHIGLIVLMFGGILTARTRTETTINLRKGESVELPDHAKIVLVDMKHEQYSDGRPKNWESTVEILESPQRTSSTEASTLKTVHQFQIRVNAPLRRKGYSIYQQNWISEKEVVLKDPMGISIQLEQGTRVATKDGFVLFMTLDTSQGVGGAAAVANAAAPAVTAAPSAIFLLEQNGERSVVKAVPSEKIGSFTFSGYLDQSISGLAVVSDRGYPLVAAGSILVVLGILLTYVQKLKGILA